MGKLIPELISLLVPSTIKKERNNFTARVKKETILKQKGKCAICRGRVNRWERDFHHKRSLKQFTQDVIEKSMQKRTTKMISLGPIGE